MVNIGNSLKGAELEKRAENWVGGQPPTEGSGKGFVCKVRILKHVYIDGLTQEEGKLQKQSLQWGRMSSVSECRASPDSVGPVLMGIQEVLF